MSGSRSRAGVHLVSYARTQDTPANDLAEAFALMLAHARAGLAWQDEALCAEVDPELWFPEKGASTREAKRTCMACEVRSECLEYALDNKINHGVWGGKSDRERNAILRKRERETRAA
jgi:WhiB family redox-sensing transcriptional regulator